MAELLFELGTEELPASFIEPLLEQIETALRAGCEAAHLKHGELKRYGTPRRLAVAVKDIAEKSDDIKREVTGPSVSASFDADGKPRQSALKFAEGHKLSVEQLKRVKTPKGEYLAATVEEKGRRASEILAQVLSDCVHKLNFPKSMRWGDVEFAFGRPLHWIVALLDSEVIPVVFADVKSGRQTKGHRFLHSGTITLEHPRDYAAALEKAHVVADSTRRRAMLVERVEAAAKKAGGALLKDDALIDQVNNLVEQPFPVVGQFEARHLDLPPEVLIQEMKSHQRYFSLVDAGGKLLPKFIAVSNTPVKDEQLSVRGYERVLKARLSDGRFFFDEDRRTPLIDRVPKLQRVQWLGQLGSFAEKVDRFRALAVFLARSVGAEKHIGTIERASTLAKADLVTGMVGEFPELQGVMGREYAKYAGEPAEVALAIYEHYLPRSANDALPTQDAGALIGLADRFDSLCGIFGIGKAPTGANDQFGLRRACLAIINITLGRGYRYSLAQAVDEALKLLEPGLKDVKRKPTDAPVKTQVLDFFRARLKALFGEAHRADVIEAVLAAGFDDLVAVKKRLDALSPLVPRPDFAPLAVTFKRVANIVEKQAKDVSAGKIDPARLTDAAEKTLFAELEKVKSAALEDFKADHYERGLSKVVTLKPSVDLFFDKVMVMADDKALRENRVRLLMEIGALFGRVADFAKIQAD